MNFSFITRLVSLVLAIGFFFACSSSKPTLDDLIINNKYESALLLIDEQLVEDPNNPALLIRKGELNLQFANTLDPRERTDFYSTAYTAFEQANSYNADSIQQAYILSSVNKYWTQEHNAGTASFSENQMDSTVLISQAHFRNATIIKPEEANSYLSLATAYYSSGDINAAISTLNLAKNSTQNTPPAIYENLGFLYLQNGEPDQSIFYYEIANTDIMESKNIAFGLVNAYISASNSEKAIEWLSNLVENYPNDASIRNVYGTQLYKVTVDILTDLKPAYTELDTSLVEQLKFEAEGVGEQAENELIQAYSRDTTDTNFTESLAVFYNNLTGKYLSLIDVAFENDKESLTAKASTLLNFAIQYYESLSNISPQNDSVETTLKDLKTLKQLRFNS